MKYLKYEKTLFEISEKQAEEFIACVNSGKKIIINQNVLMAGKCEIISKLPHNHDEYLIVSTPRAALSNPYDASDLAVKDFEKKLKDFYGKQPHKHRTFEHFLLSQKCIVNRSSYVDVNGKERMTYAIVSIPLFSKFLNLNNSFQNLRSRRAYVGRKELESLEATL